MKLLDKISGIFQSKVSKATKLTTMFLGGTSPPKDQREFDLAKEGYSQVGICYACVREIAVAFAGIKWSLFKMSGGEKVEIKQHPILDLWNRPNRHQGSAAFLQAVASHYLIAGNSYIESAEDNSGVPQYLYTLRPDRMSVIPDPVNRIGGYKFTNGGSFINYIGDEILHFKDFHPTNDWYGLSPIAVAALSIDSYKNQQRWNVGLMDNFARPSGIISYEDDLSPEALNNIKEEFMDTYAGSKNANKPMVFEGGKMKWEQMAFNPKELDFVKSQGLSALQICQVFNLPPELVGLQPSTYQNRREARKALYTENVLPMTDRFRDDFNNWLPQKFGEPELFFEPDLDDIEALQEDREKLWKRLDESEELTLNEKRVGKGYDEIDDGDVIFISSSKTPLDSALNPPEPSTEEDFTDDEEPDDDPLATIEDDPFKTVKQEKGARSEMLAVARMRKRFSRRMATAIKRLFEVERGRVIEALSRFGLDAEDNIINEIDSSKEDWENLIVKNRLDTMRAFGDRALKQFKSDNPDIETKATEEEIFIRQMRIAANLHVAEMIQNVSNTTKKKVRKVIADGATAGKTLPQITSEIQASYKGFTKKRAGVIALTETVTAQNRGSMEAINSLKTPVLKVWLWSGITGENERPEHHDVDGQAVEKEAYFSVGGEELLHPGDPLASAKNRVNCHCSLTYRRDEQ
jgi:HK97 family phage portal protein